MSRFVSTLKIDIISQFKTKLYHIGVVVSLLVGVILSFLLKAEKVDFFIPTIILLVSGGSTLLYVASMIIFERDEGTINANMISPLKVEEYLLSKVLTLTFLSTLESLLIVFFTKLFLKDLSSLLKINFSLLLSGIIAIGIIYSLIGIILIVRFRNITDFLIPVSLIATILQMPFLYFLEISKQTFFLIIPTSFPTMIMQSAFFKIPFLQFISALSFTFFIILILSFWSIKAFQKHIILNLG